MTKLSPREAIDLLDWKRLVFDLYREIRATDNPTAAWHRWRTVRDELFWHHPASPLPPETRRAFRGVPYFDYDPACRVLAELVEAPFEPLEIQTSTGDAYDFSRFGRIAFELRGTRYELDVYWLATYGGGVFLPFTDATTGRETYRGGRYLLDTVKGADFGRDGEGRPAGAFVESIADRDPSG